jgi:NAD(P)-dependent dehydrogenase (short-subunit alcohol dehydrogenase family)
MGDILEGKVAVITGSGRGMGRAHALAIAAQSAKVVVNDPGVDVHGVGIDKSPADEVVAEIRKKGGEAVANYDSVATSKGAANLIKTAVDNFGRLDILVNNAGIFGRFAWIWELTDEEFDKMIKTHLYGHFYCAREAVKVFRNQNYGRIINVSSSAGLAQGYGDDKYPRNVHYSSAKESIVGLTRTLASEVASEAGIPGVTVNCIRPGAGTRLMQTLVLERLTKEVGLKEAKRQVEMMIQNHPPEAVASLVVFLASDAASNVNGCIFYVDAGEVSIYHDPPYKVGTVWKKGLWTPEELVELLPKTLTAEKVRKPMIKEDFSYANYASE